MICLNGAFLGTIFDTTEFYLEVPEEKLLINFFVWHSMLNNVW